MTVTITALGLWAVALSAALVRVELRERRRQAPPTSPPRRALKGELIERLSPAQVIVTSWTFTGSPPNAPAGGTYTVQVAIDPDGDDRGWKCTDYPTPSEETP